MSQQLSSFSTAQILLKHELYAFSSRMVADLFQLDKFQTTRLLHRMERDGLVVGVERGKYLLLGLTPEKGNKHIMQLRGVRSMIGNAY